MCAGVSIAFGTLMFTGLDVAYKVDGYGESVGVGSTVGCSVALSSGDCCLGPAFMFLALVAHGGFSCLGFLEFLGGSLAFGGILEKGFTARKRRTLLEVFIVDLRVVALLLCLALGVQSSIVVSRQDMRKGGR